MVSTEFLSLRSFSEGFILPEVTHYTAYALPVTIVSLPLTTFLAIQKNMDSWELLTKISVSMPTTTDYFYFDFF